MSITAPAAGEVFTIRVYKEGDVAPTQVWANNYEVRAQAVATADELLDAATSIVAFERAIHQDTVRFNRVVISTWAPDGVPLAVGEFRSVPLSGLGLVASPVNADTLPLQAVLFVKREVAVGRYGKLFYRRALEEGDVNGRFGDLTLEPAALTAVTARLNAALASSGMDTLLDGTDQFRLTMAGGSGAVPSNIRDVLGLTVAGARLVKWNNRYFDRA